MALLLAAPPRTFRVDYFHTGNAAEERFSLDRLVLEPLPFPGRPDRALDDTNLGKYFFEVRELATNRVVYSRGFTTICTGPEGAGKRSDSENVRYAVRASAVVSHSP